jgi:hypothetical protein
MWRRDFRPAQSFGIGSESFDLEIFIRVLHRIEMTGLSGEVEEIILFLHELLYAVFVAHVGDVDVHLVFDFGNVEQAPRHIAE